jgi:hypothetical protein
MNTDQRIATDQTGDNYHEEHEEHKEAIKKE